MGVAFKMFKSGARWAHDVTISIVNDVTTDSANTLATVNNNILLTECYDSSQDPGAISCNVMNNGNSDVMSPSGARFKHFKSNSQTLTRHKICLN